MQVNNQFNQLQPQRKASFSVTMQTPKFKQLISNTLQDKKKAERFTTSIISAVSVNPALQECDAATIVSSALLGETLGLSPSPQLGHFYMVPFKNNKLGKTDAQFQLGYKGYIQLAIRSGQYRKINAVAIKEGELVHYDRLYDEIELDFIQDDEVREKTPTVGYVAYFELVNGFKKVLYWSKKKMEQHALKYSKGYAAKKGYTFWEKDFDGMARKTVIRQLISKWGIMSIDMVTAYESDMAVVEADGSKVYVDNNDDYVEATFQEKTVVETQTQQTIQNQEVNYEPF